VLSVPFAIYQHYWKFLIVEERKITSILAKINSLFILTGRPGSPIPPFSPGIPGSPVSPFEPLGP